MSSRTSTPLLSLLTCLTIALGLLFCSTGCIEADGRGENNVLNKDPGDPTSGVTSTSTSGGSTETCQCNNGATCDAGGKCICLEGFFGTTCEQVCDCKNGASCSDGVNGDGTCDCAAGYYGASCESECTCAAEFICRDGANGDGVCLCKNGEVAPGCGATACDCQNGGSCSGDPVMCVCPDGFWGPKCENSCDCKNGAACSDGAAGTGKCACPLGFWGDDCGKACDCGGGACDATTGMCGGCAPGKFGTDCMGTCNCQNGATCNEGTSGDGTCACATGFFGSTCESACDCQNGATCADGAAGDGTCACQLGYWGTRCDQECPGGAANACSGNGTCADGATGNGECVCNPGFGGPECKLMSSCTDAGDKVGDVMIVEVMYDAPNGGGFGEPQGEYVLLYNNSCGSITLTGWELCDSAGCDVLKAITFKPGEVITIIYTKLAQGYETYSCGAGPKPLVFDRVDAFTSGTWFASNLSNSGDAVEIKNKAGVRIDGMSYQSNSSISMPSIKGGDKGKSLHRLGYPWSGLLPANSGAAVWEPMPMAGHICGVSTGKAM